MSGAPAAGNVGRFQYTGQMWMAELKLYHFKARAYHPALGRFLQTDPIGYGDGLNLYQYAGSDPVNARDPSGMVDTVVVHGVRTGCSPGASCISGSADIRDFLNAFNQTLNDLFRDSFGSGEGSVGDQTKDAVDKTLCGSSGTAVSGFDAAARLILPGRAAEQSMLARALEYAYGSSSRALDGFNAQDYRGAYGGRDVGAYVSGGCEVATYILSFGSRCRYGSSRINGTPYSVGQANISAPGGFCFDCQGGHEPPGGVVATVVAPNTYAYPGRQQTGFGDYQARIAERTPIYLRAAQNTGAPVVVGTPHGLCVFK